MISIQNTSAIALLEQASALGNMFLTDVGEPRQKRNPSLVVQRLNWSRFVMTCGQSKEFKRHLRMKLESFNKLVSLLQEQLNVNGKEQKKRGGEIIPELQLYCTIRWLAGGIYSDIFYFCGISKTSFYFVVWRTIQAINRCVGLNIFFPKTVEECDHAAQGVRSVSNGEAIDSCVVVIDGYHLEIHAPPKKTARTVRSYFSGHYQSYGLNCQAACDHHSRFNFFGVAGPGVMSDRDAVKQVPLAELIEQLPGLYCAIADCAYTPTEHMIPVFGGALALQKRNDNFNFYASQCRIRIEMACGMMVQKFGVLQRPLRIGLKNVKHMMNAIVRLHNFCINERLSRGQNAVPDDARRGIPIFQEALRTLGAVREHDTAVSDEYPQWSLNRERLVERVAAKHLERPTKRQRTNR